jgi:conjugative relaxase-like TrwC/TraI family protein
MITITKQVKEYKYYMKDDFYSKDDPNYKKLTCWYGNGAADLGLKGEISAQDYDNIIAGILPNGIRIGIKKCDEFIHDKGRDLTFSAPKSVSVMALVYGDKRLITAHDEAVKATLKIIETNYFGTRIKKDQKSTIEKTNNLIAATFRHHLSRDLDPQIHTHAITANLTKDKDGKWKSGYFDNIFDNRNHFTAIYRSVLAFEVKKLGYEIDTYKKCLFQIKSVPQEICDLFSSRSKKIKEFAKENFGPNPTPKQLEQANLLTRKPKKKNEYQNYQQIWQKKIKELFKSKESSILKNQLDALTEFSKNIITKTKKFFEEITIDQQKLSLKNAKSAVDYAIKHLSERNTTFSHENLFEVAIQDKLSLAHPKDIEKQITRLIKQGRLLRGSIGGYTTKNLLDKELAIIEIMKSGKQKHRPIITNSIDQYLDPKLNLNDGQKAAANLILTTKDRVIGIQGFAGVGKTHMLKTVNNIASKQGYELLGLAPTGSATRNLNNQSGIQSVTLQFFLSEGGYAGVAKGGGTKEGIKDMIEEFKNKIVIIDEAGMISSDQMKDLLTISQKLNFKLVTVGDDKQIDAVEAGCPMAFLPKAGMEMAYMTDIIRQTKRPSDEFNPHYDQTKQVKLRSAIYDTIDKEISSAFSKINIAEIKIPDGEFIEYAEFNKMIRRSMSDHFLSLEQEQG